MGLKAEIKETLGQKITDANVTPEELREKFGIKFSISVLLYRFEDCALGGMWILLFCFLLILPISRMLPNQFFPILLFLIFVFWIGESLLASLFFTLSLKEEEKAKEIAKKYFPDKLIKEINQRLFFVLEKKVREKLKEYGDTPSAELIRKIVVSECERACEVALKEIERVAKMYEIELEANGINEKAVRNLGIIFCNVSAGLLRKKCVGECKEKISAVILEKILKEIKPKFSVRF